MREEYRRYWSVYWRDIHWSLASGEAGIQAIFTRFRKESLVRQPLGLTQTVPSDLLSKSLPSLNLPFNIQQPLSFPDNPEHIISCLSAVTGSVTLWSLLSHTDVDDEGCRRSNFSPKENY